MLRPEYTAAIQCGCGSFPSRSKHLGGNTCAFGGFCVVRCCLCRRRKLSADVRAARHKEHEGNTTSCLGTAQKSPSRPTRRWKHSSRGNCAGRKWQAQRKQSWITRWDGVRQRKARILSTMNYGFQLWNNLQDKYRDQASLITLFKVNIVFSIRLSVEASVPLVSVVVSGNIKGKTESYLCFYWIYIVIWFNVMSHLGHLMDNICQLNFFLR